MQEKTNIKCLITTGLENSLLHRFSLSHSIGGMDRIYPNTKNVPIFKGGGEHCLNMLLQNLP